MSELAVGQLKGLLVNNNVITVPSGHTFYAPGHIVQVVQAVKSNTASYSMAAGSGTPTTSNTYSVMSAQITPKYANSKILVTGNIRYAGASSTPSLVLFRGTDPVGIGDAGSGQRRTTTGTGLQVDTNQLSGSGDFSYLDSPLTTALTTYEVRIWSDNGNITYINRTTTDSAGATGVRAISTLTLMEVAQ